MARAMWKGAIQFGLVTIPIKLYLATESKGLSFNMLHKDDLSRIQMKVWCPVEDEAISRGDTVKGYEYSPGEYVVITDEDLEKVPLKTVRSIEIEQFTHAERDDNAVRFVKSAYYVEPDKIGRKAFYLLKSVLEDEGLTAICKVVIKDREALAALDPFGETLLLSTLHWPDEIRSTDDLDLPAEEFDFKPAELAMAKQLVSAMTGEFDPAPVQGRVPRGAREDHRRQGRGQGDRRDRGARGERQAHRPDGRPRGLGQRGQDGARRRHRGAGVGRRGPRAKEGHAPRRRPPRSPRPRPRTTTTRTRPRPSPPPASARPRRARPTPPRPRPRPPSASRPRRPGAAPLGARCWRVGSTLGRRAVVTTPWRRRWPATAGRPDRGPSIAAAVRGRPGMPGPTDRTIDRRTRLAATGARCTRRELPGPRR